MNPGGWAKGRGGRKTECEREREAYSPLSMEPGDTGLDLSEIKI